MAATLEPVKVSMPHDESNQLELFKAMFRHSAEAIVICNAEGELTYFNEATRTIHGKDVAHLPPEQWASTFDLFHPDGRPMAAEEVPLRRAFRGETLSKVPMVIAPKNGGKRKLLASGESLFDPQGRRIGAVVVMREVDEFPAKSAKG